MLFLYFLQHLLFPKLAAVAFATAKSEMSQPLFLICLLIGAFALALYIWIPYNTFGEDIKMLKDSGMTTIMVLAIITALWAASTSVAEEIEKLNADYKLDEAREHLIRYVERGGEDPRAEDWIAELEAAGR
mgnify:CR=1 FL=1